jgi:hypothetical protein
VVVVDYALPEARLSRWLVFHTVKLYEREPYVDFISWNLPRALEAVGLRIREDRRRLLGSVRWVIAAKLTPDTAS